MTDKITIRFLKPSDIYPQMLQSFHHKQVISNKWIKKEEHYELIDTHEVREWDTDKRVWITQYLCQQMNRGGFALGAFCGNRMVGFASLDGILKGIPEKYANLTMLFVDDEWRRQGIGKGLFKQICLCAEKMKADKVFISAIPSFDTISFYLKLGCTDAQYIVDSFVDTQQDRYLEYSLKETHNVISSDVDI